MSDDLLSLDEAAERLGVHKETVRRRIRRGEIKAEKINGPFGEQYFVPESEIRTAQKIVDVIPVAKEITPQEFIILLDQATKRAIQPLQQQIETLQQQYIQAVETLKNQHKQDMEALNQLYHQNAIESLKQEVVATREENKKLRTEIALSSQETKKSLEDINKSTNEIKDWAVCSTKDLTARIGTIENKKSWYQRIFGR
ncbi:hypothetical protein JCM14036_02680 [Desulfotomaculum defluvii]